MGLSPYSSTHWPPAWGRAPLTWAGGVLLDQFVDLARFAIPLVGVWQRRLALGDALPAVGKGQVGVELDESNLVGRQIFFGKDGVGRAFGDADGAVDAFIGVDDKHVRAFAEAVHGAHVHTIGVLALDAVFGDDVGHDRSCVGR